MAVHNIRSNFFHTLLSILGIVIGVASLVIILSLIDGMEQFARDQISATTNLRAVVIQSEPYRTSNEVRIRKDTFSVLSYANYEELANHFSAKGNLYWVATASAEVAAIGSDTTVGSLIKYVSPSVTARLFRSAGEDFDNKDFADTQKLAIINRTFAVTLQPDSSKWEQFIGTKVTWAGETYTVKGVVSRNTPSPEVFLPGTLATTEIIKAYPPQCILEANQVEQVTALKGELDRWLKSNVGAGNDFTIVTNEFRVEQAAKGFFLFRLIMGLIVGVSVVVGGIGVMNVLLISVTERTSEIGIRKAMGATRRDIVMQFLAESITVSIFGSLTGLLLGFLTTLALVPIVKMLVKVPFQAAYTWNTFGVVSVIAVLVGVVFGTYPALRAARLDPVEAIRRE